MKFLQEVMVDVRRLDSEDTSDLDLELDLDADTGVDADVTPDTELSLDAGNDSDELSSDDPIGGLEGPEPGFDGPDLSGGSMGGLGSDTNDSELSLGEEPEPESENDQFDGIAQDATEDPNRQGLVRTVKGAHLVYKRETEEGTFEELWLYNVSDFRTELNTKKAILAGTDIPPNKTRSPDGSQTYSTWAAGNAEMLLIRGLPN